MFAHLQHEKIKDICRSKLIPSLLSSIQLQLQLLHVFFILSRYVTAYIHYETSMQTFNYITLLYIYITFDTFLSIHATYEIFTCPFDSLGIIEVTV